MDAEITRELEERIDLLVESQKLIRKAMQKVIQQVNALAKENNILREKMNSVIQVSNIHSENLDVIRDALKIELVDDEPEPKEWIN